MEGFGGAIVSPYSAMSLSQYFSSGATEGMDATMSESGASCSGSSSNSSGSKMSSPEDQQFQLPSNILFGGDLKVENESGLDYQYQMLDPGAIFRNMNCHQYQPQLMTGFHLQSEALHNELPQQVGQLQTQIPQQEIPYAHITVCENCGTFETCEFLQFSSFFFLSFPDIIDTSLDRSFEQACGGEAVSTATRFYATGVDCILTERVCYSVPCM